MQAPVSQFVISRDTDSRLESWAAGAMVGDPEPFPIARSALSAAQFLAFTEFHGVTALLWANAAARDAVPQRYIDAMGPTVRWHVARELVLQHELGQVLAAARAGGLLPLVLKGTAFAYSLYPEPSVRQRHDTDLLVRPDEKRAVVELLQSLGYTGDLIAAEHWATSERSFTKPAGQGIVSRIDLHWRVSNSPLFWRPELDCARLRLRAQQLGRLSEATYCPARPVLLLHACIHRAGHARAPMTVRGSTYAASNRLIWLYDIHLLASAFDDAAWGEFLELAGRVQVREICRAALSASTVRFQTRIASVVVDALAPRRSERSASHIRSSECRVKLLEFWALPSLRARAGWVREHLLPGRDYMRARFGDQRACLARLYARRALTRVRTALRTPTKASVG
jgi:hypothetical protein